MADLQEQVARIYEAEREAIYSYLLCFRVPPGRAQELTQDTFLKLYRKMADGREEIENPRAWLYRAAHNFALRFHEREPAFDELDPDSPAFESSPSPERSLLDRERQAALARRVAYTRESRRAPDFTTAGNGLLAGTGARPSPRWSGRSR